MILVAESANLDFVVRTPHIPAPGETVLGGEFRTYPGGKGARALHGRNARCMGPRGAELCKPVIPHFVHRQPVRPAVSGRRSAGRNPDGCPLEASIGERSLGYS